MAKKEKQDCSNCACAPSPDWCTKQKDMEVAKYMSCNGWQPIIFIPKKKQEPRVPRDSDEPIEKNDIDAMRKSICLSCLDRKTCDRAKFNNHLCLNPRKR